MKTIEGQVRDLLREFGDQISRDGAPPLRLPGLTATQADGVAHLTGLAPATSRRPAAPAARRLHRTLAPAAAAAAVLVIAVTAATIAASAPDRRPGKPAAPASTVPGGVPPYYVALELVPGTLSGPDGGIEIAVVRSTMTGKALATVQVPKSSRSFVGVTAAADDRTFVLAAGAAVPVPSVTRFYRLTIDPSAASQADRARLTLLPAPVEPKGVFFHGFALSPDGARLAVSVFGPDRPGHASPAHVQVIDLASGRVRTITTYASGLYWENDSQTLALTGWRHDDKHWHVTLERTGPDSHGPGRVVLRLSSPVNVDWRGLAVTPDGRTAIATKVYDSKTLTPLYTRLEKYDIATGKLGTVIDKRTVRLGAESQLAWSDPSGQVLLEIYVATHRVPGSGWVTSWVAAILIGHQYHRIPWPGSAMTGAW